MLAFGGDWPSGGSPMNVFYRIQHSGEEIAAADSIEQAKAIVRDSRPGAYHVFEVRENPLLQSQLCARDWGILIHPDDGPVIVDSRESTGRTPSP
jgi:hypothetical protein